MSAYAIRVTPRNQEDVDAFKKALEKLGGGYLVVKETATREHLHALVYSEFNTIKVRSTLHSTMGKVGNGVISCKACPNPPGYFAYICKGDAQHPEPQGDEPDVLWTKGVWCTKDAIKAKYDEYWARSDEIKENKDLSLSVAIEHSVVANQLTFSAEDVCKTAIAISLGRGKPINKFYLAGCVRLVLANKNRAYRKELELQLLRDVLGDAYATFNTQEDSSHRSPSPGCSSRSCSPRPGRSSCVSVPEPVCARRSSAPECVSDW